MPMESPTEVDDENIIRTLPIKPTTNHGLGLMIHCKIYGEDQVLFRCAHAGWVSPQCQHITLIITQTLHD